MLNPNERSMLRFPLVVMIVGLVLTQSCSPSQDASPALPTNTPPAVQAQTPAPSPIPTPQAPPVAVPTLDVEPIVLGAYLMAFHACDAFHVDCYDPRNHELYLAHSEDGLNWAVVPGWKPVQGSVPDVIRRGDTIYVFSGPNLVRYHVDTSQTDAPVSVDVVPAEGSEGQTPVMPTDVSLFIDEQERLVMFFLYGMKGGDPADCGPGEQTCEKHIGSATEVENSDGSQFVVDPGYRITTVAGPAAPTRSVSDPDIVGDGQGFYLYLSHGTWVSVWTSPELRGAYAPVEIPPLGFLIAGSGGVASGYYDPTEGMYWTYAHIQVQEGGIIRRAVHKEMTKQLEEKDWEVVLTGEVLGLGPGFNVESPGFAVNVP